jgi:O-antigen/teichoic acid export membrane protein
MMLLIYYPTGMLQKLITTMHLPLIAGADEGDGKRRAADRLGGQTLLLGLVFLIGYAALAPFAIPLLYGAGFGQPALLIAATGVLQVIRFLRLWPVTAALALGHSRTVLLSNFLRLLAFPLALLSTDLIGGLLGILLAFALAEALAFLVSLMLVTRQLGARRRSALERSHCLRLFPLW